MPNHKINWINDHTQICDRFNERVQRMQDYLDGKPDEFDGIDVKRFLLGQAREQITWYRQSMEALDFVGSVHVTHLASKNRIPVQTCYAILHEIEARGDYEVSWGLVDDGYSDTVYISRTTTERKS